MSHDDELQARNMQLETTGQALTDNAVPNPDGSDTYVVDTDVLDEFRAVLNGNATPAAPPRRAT